MGYLAIGAERGHHAANDDTDRTPMTWRLLGSNSLSTAVLLLVLLTMVGCSTNIRPEGASSARSLGAMSIVGKGTVSSFAAFANDGTPQAIGIVFPASTLEGLPSAHSDGHHCFDRNKDGRIDRQTECFATHEWVIPLPSDAARRADIPFKWVGLNWNAHGHIPPGVYDLPHFDVHFYIESIEKVFAIIPGPCGPEFVNCDQFKIATKPLPSNYMHADFKSVDAVAPAMGNHLIDLTGPEFRGNKFTRTWIFGTYDGRVTFYEEMVTREFLLTRPDACFPIKSPSAVGVRGYYPTKSCIRYRPHVDEYTIAMEDYVLREAGAPR